MTSADKAMMLTFMVLFASAVIALLGSIALNNASWKNYYEYRCEYKQIGTDATRNGIVCRGKEQESK